MEIMLIKKVGTNWQFDNILVYWEMMMMMKMGTNWKSLVQNEAWIKCGCSYGYQIVLFFGLVEGISTNEADFSSEIRRYILSDGIYLSIKS